MWQGPMQIGRSEKAKAAADDRGALNVLSSAMAIASIFEPRTFADRCWQRREAEDL